ncbi:MAG: hypothetical protein ABIN36_12035 [Ferruginibacter sp.]
MKKIFTLILTVSLGTAAFAQYDNRQGNERNDDVAYNDRHDRRDHDRHSDRGNYFKKREMQKQIAAINREYERKICNVKDNWYMSPFRKQRIINELENHRSFEIREVYARFSDRGYRRNW